VELGHLGVRRVQLGGKRSHDRVFGVHDEGLADAGDAVVPASSSGWSAWAEKPLMVWT
jgi:hypothetical protein